ncbi:MFS transporter [Frigoribacterium sp. CFBP9030]|uniref:MFS transporter n=1 Tax=Frigoribacterium sp. CFBP9030 TaxID=3096537 RepID=UPI002A6A2AAE|nr:MFS transporter [Frigoribacterium sp. CFBP9030]MDY0892077.1 MFS transporter [Frigoribacterium sp. CFBP9030]
MTPPAPPRDPAGPGRLDAESAPGSWSRPVALVVAAAFFMENLDATILSTATASIARDFEVVPAEVGIAVTSYLVAVAAFIPLGAWLAERWGARRVFLAAIVLFTVASLACALSGDLVSLTASRAVQGLAGSMMVPIGRLIVLRSTEKSELIRAIAYLTWPALVAPVIAPLVGGLLTEHLGWQWVFLVNVPVGAALLVAAWRVIPAVPRAPRARLDVVGLGLVVAAVVSGVVAFELLGGAPTAVTGAGLLVLAVLLVLAAGRWFRRVAHPLLDLTAFRIPSFRVTNLSGSVYRAVVNGVPFVVPLLLQDGFGWSPAEAGLMLTWVFVGNLGVKPFTTPLLRRLAVIPIVTVSTVGLAATFVGAALVTAETSPVVIALVLLASGVFRSVGFTAYNTLQFADVPPERLGAANALSSITGQLAVGLGVALTALVVRIADGVLGTTGVGDPTGYRIALIVLAALALVSIVEGLSLPRGTGASLRAAPR